MDKTIIEKNFKTQNLSEVKLNEISKIKSAGKSLADMINDICPESREKSVAFTELETAIMWAVASISRYN